MITEVINPSPAVASSLDEHHIAVTFSYSGQLYTLIGLPSAEDYFICHKTGRHLKYDPTPHSMFMVLTEFFSRHELWEVPQ